MANARAKSEQADTHAEKSMHDCDIARKKATEYAPEFNQPGTDLTKTPLEDTEEEYDFSHVRGLQNHNPHQLRGGKPDINPTQESSMFSPNLGLSPTGLGGNKSNPQNPGSDFHYLGVNSIPNQALPGGNQETGNHAPHSRSPSLKIRRYSFLAGSRRGRGFSEIFNSTILNDHFDQYGGRDDSGFGREYLPGEDNHIKLTVGSDVSPDSGVSDSIYEENKHRPLQRRRTMPCIVKEDQTENEAKAKEAVVAAETAHSSENLVNVNADRFIIENGIRKRIKAKECEVRGSNPGLTKEFEIESQNKLGRKRGSLPDIAVIKKTEAMKPMPREEAYKLASAQRDEVRRLQQLADRRRQGDIGVLMGDLRDWCQQRQLLVFVIALNVSLATMFFNLLS